MVFWIRIVAVEMKKRVSRGMIFEGELIGLLMDRWQSWGNVREKEEGRLGLSLLGKW